MMKKTVCSIALAAALVPFVQSAPAQNYKGTPKPAISDYGVYKEAKTSPSPTSAAPASSSDTKAGTCGNPAARCLFYGGDFAYDPLGSTVANGVANENNTFVSGIPYGAAVWVPFTVPAGETWEVTGLFTNNLSAYGVLDQAPTEPYSAATWSINEGVEPGLAGTVVASGTSAATSTPTGRFGFGLLEYTVQVTGLSFTLTPGTYWLSVVPLCTNTADPYCGGVFFLSDVEYINSPAAQAFGPAEPADAAFLDSTYFGLSFDPTNGPLGACGGLGCDSFSAGVLGTKTK